MLRTHRIVPVLLAAIFVSVAEAAPKSTRKLAPLRPPPQAPAYAPSAGNPAALKRNFELSKRYGQRIRGYTDYIDGEIKSAQRLPRRAAMARLGRIEKYSRSMLGSLAEAQRRQQEYVDFLRAREGVSSPDGGESEASDDNWAQYYPEPFLHAYSDPDSVAHVTENIERAAKNMAAMEDHIASLKRGVREARSALGLENAPDPMEASVTLGPRSGPAPEPDPEREKMLNQVRRRLPRMEARLSLYEQRYDGTKRFKEQNIQILELVMKKVRDTLRPLENGEARPRRRGRLKVNV